MTKTTAELAADFDTTPRTLRKFLRSNDSGIESVGKGSRYALPSAKRDIAAMKKRFDTWGAAQVEKKTEQVDNSPEVDNEVIDEVENFDDLENPLDA